MIDDELIATPGRFDLLQGLALVEALHHSAHTHAQGGRARRLGAGRALGEGVGPYDEGVEFETHSGHGFVGRSLLAISRVAPTKAKQLNERVGIDQLGAARDSSAWRVLVSVGGLLGHDAPLPDVLGEELQDGRARGARAFLDIFAGRLIAAFYRARKVAFPALGYLGNGDDWLCSFLGAFGGLVFAVERRSHRRMRAGSAGVWGFFRRYSGLLSEDDPSWAGLERLLDDLVNGFELIGEFERSWQRAQTEGYPTSARATARPCSRRPGRAVAVEVGPLPTRVAIDADSLTRIGRRLGNNNRLGRGATLGRHYCEQIGGVGVELRYRDWPSFASSLFPALYPSDRSGVSLVEIERASAIYIGRSDLAQFRLRLPARELPRCVLHSRASIEAARSRSGPPGSDPDDPRPGVILGYTSWLGGRARASASGDVEIKVDAARARRRLPEPRPELREPRAARAEAQGRRGGQR